VLCMNKMNNTIARVFLVFCVVFVCVVVGGGGGGVFV